MSELSPEIHDRIKALCAEGDGYAEEQSYDDALKRYWSAWDLLPAPKEDWEAATWVLAAVGDANFLARDFEAGRDNLSNAMRCPGAIGNPFLHLRLGQCQLELGNEDRAADELTRAFMGVGEDIFREEDPKYLAFVQTRIATEPAAAPSKPWWKIW